MCSLEKGKMAEDQGKVEAEKKEDIDETTSGQSDAVGEKNDKTEGATDKVPVYVPGPTAVDITPDKDGGVTKEILTLGTGEDGPLANDTVFVHYDGYLTDGTKFCSSGELFAFSLGKGSVIKAWDLAVATMKRGEQCLIQCSAEYSYGKEGFLPQMPSDSTLTFEIELLNWIGEDISEDQDGGILRSIVAEGEGNQPPRDLGTCDVHITGTFGGHVFEDRNVTFVVGLAAEAGITAGIEQAVKKSKQGEKSKLVVKPKYAYGAQGNLQYGIPPDATLEYEVEVKSFEMDHDTDFSNPIQDADMKLIYLHLQNLDKKQVTVERLQSLFAYDAFHGANLWGKTLRIKPSKSAQISLGYSPQVSPADSIKNQKRQSDIKDGSEHAKRRKSDDNNKSAEENLETAARLEHQTDTQLWLDVTYQPLEWDEIGKEDVAEVDQVEAYDQISVPNVVSGSQHGEFDVTEEDGDSFDYDLVVIGGGSGGLSAAKEASALGAKVVLLDFVKASPKGTSWGLGGSCVNVGCIPKKLAHQAGLLGDELADARNYGWEFQNPVRHNWKTMTSAIQAHTDYVNWVEKVELRSAKVKYMKAFATFTGPRCVKATNAEGQVTKLSSKCFIIATGCRPKYPDFPGSNFCITSDDLFKLPSSPGKVLVIGSGVIAMECAGFLNALGLDVAIMAQSACLRGFDQQMVNKILTYMKHQGVKFISPCVPNKVDQVRDAAGVRYLVKATIVDAGTEFVDEYDTVLVATGRSPCTPELNLACVGVNIDQSGYILCDDEERTSCPYVFAIGDILHNKPRLAPVAEQAGRLLAKRLFSSSCLKCDYSNVPINLSTPLEYGCVGLSEEDAVAEYGTDDIKVYHSSFTPLEWTVTVRKEDVCYAKLVCVISQKEKVVGLHVLSPKAGEITQGWTVALKNGCSKPDFDRSIGIHPTCTEIFTNLRAVKGSDAASGEH